MRGQSGTAPGRPTLSQLITVNRSNLLLLTFGLPFQQQGLASHGSLGGGLFLQRHVRHDISNEEGGYDRLQAQARVEIETGLELAVLAPAGSGEWRSQLQAPSHDSGLQAPS